MPNPCRQRSFWARIKLSKQKILYEPKFIFYLVQKSLTCFSIVVFLTKYFASSHYFDHYDRNSFINGLIALFKFSRNTQTQKQADNSCYSQTATNYSLIQSNICFICYPFNGFHLKHICVMPQNLFFFWMINMLCFAWSLNLSHFSHLSSWFSNFFRFFSTCVIRKIFLRRASCFIAYQNALLRILQLFENLLEEHRAFLQN